MANVTIGSVTFTYALFWTNKGEQVVIGSKRRTRSGNLVTLTVENPSQGYKEAKLIFDWLPKEDIDTLIGYWRAGGTYTANFEGGSSCTVRFDPQNGVKEWKHEVWGERTVHAYVEGEETDIYYGELNLIIEA